MDFVSGVKPMFRCWLDAFTGASTWEIGKELLRLPDDDVDDDDDDDDDGYDYDGICRRR